MGVTVLNVEQAELGQSVVLHFSREGRGAERWRRVVDALDEVIEDLERLRGFTAAKPDGRRSLGRGARRIVPRRSLPLIVAAWQRIPDVRAGIASGEVRVDGELGSPLVLALARRWVADAFRECGSCGAALRDCFE